MAARFRWKKNWRVRDENPVRSVTVNSFYMCKHEVTQKEWFDVMGIKQYELNKNAGKIFLDIGDNKPVYYMSWYDAIEYCNKRSIKEVYRRVG